MFWKRISFNGTCWSAFGKAEMVDSATWLPLVKYLLQPSIPSSQERFNTWVCDNPAVVETGGGRDAFEAETQTMRSVRKI